MKTSDKELVLLWQRHPRIIEVARGAGIDPDDARERLIALRRAGVQLHRAGPLSWLPPTRSAERPAWVRRLNLLIDGLRKEVVA